MKRYIFKFFGVVALLSMSLACEDELEPTPLDEFVPDNVFNSEAGIEAILNSAYQYSNRMNGYKNTINMEEVMTDIAYNSGGGENRTLTLFINYTFDASNNWILNDLWTQSYKAIRDANLVLDNIDNAAVEASVKTGLKAEARFIRAMEYAKLYSWFGTVPLMTSSFDDPKNRSSDEEIRTLIETDLTSAATNLPDPGEEKLYGRATNGAAFGILTKFYLNTKQWSKAADAAQSIIDLDYYELWDDYKTLFRVESEPHINPENKEMIFVMQTIPETAYGNTFPNGAFPPGFASSNQFPEFIFNSGMANWATQYRLRSAFFNSFDAADERRSLILTEYINGAGVTIDLSSKADDVRSLKYFDNNAVGNFHGNDFPIVRFADILLSRAEALNELNGPTQEALDLLNDVRERSGLGEITLAEATSKEVLRDIILQERSWEFVSENKRREDLIRHGKLISLAIERGVNARSHHVLFPIPQGEINANPMMSDEDQTEGY